MKKDGPASHSTMACQINEYLPACTDRRFDDFDAQSEQLTAHDQEYVQLSTGAFHGRFVSAFLGEGVSLHLETANQALGQRVGCPEGLISLGLVIGNGPSFKANGAELCPDRLLVTKPGRELVLNSPPGGQILAICLDQSALRLAAAGDEPIYPLDPAFGGITVIRAPELAARVRAGAMSLLRAIRAQGSQLAGRNVGRSFIGAIGAEFALHDAIHDLRPGEKGQGDYQTFVTARNVMSTSVMPELDYTRLCEATSRSVRSIQLAFARHAGTTPLRYFRAIRLADARRALQSPRRAQQTIGDVAAEYGFWNHSRFAQLYRLQFGESPSKTRARGTSRHVWQAR